MSDGYPVPTAGHEAAIEVKKSRFIARAAPACSREAALAELARARTDHPDARHHCHAYLIGNPATAASAAMGDDGEPSGTAGRPILSVIQHKGIGDVVVVVIRYFGGIKLGAGGLTRAYAGAAEAVLAELPLTARVAHCEVELTLDFAREQTLRHWAAQHGAELLAVDYAEQVHVRLRLAETERPALHALCAADPGLTLSP